MKNLVVNYNVFNNKINDTKILLLSDLHDCSKFRELKLIEDIKKEEADLIVIAGDIMCSKKYIKNSSSQKELKYFLNAISENAPVFLGLGNHDLLSLNNETIAGYKDLEKARCGKVYSLNNESIKYNDIRITEFHPRHDAYSPSIQESGKALLMFEEDYTKSGITIPDNDELYNIFICHNPKHFEQAKRIGESLKLDFKESDFNKLLKFSETISSFDLCLSGHLHNGYIPLSLTNKNPSKYMDKGYCEMPIERNIDNCISKIRPFIYKKTDMCRGAIFVGNIDKRIIQLSDNSYYIISTKDNEPKLITEKYALDYIKTHKMIPVVINGGVNKYFNFPIGDGEITKIKIMKK